MSETKPAPQQGAIQITPLSEAGGAAITGIDLSETLSPNQTEAIRQAFHESGMIVIRDQVIENDDQNPVLRCNGGHPRPAANPRTSARRMATHHTVVQYIW